MSESKARGRGTTDPQRIARFEAMSLRRFRREGALLHVDSEVFGEVVGFASDEAVASRAPRGMVVYLVPELAVIEKHGYDREGLDIIHRLKQRLNGMLLDPAETERIGKSDNKPEPEIEVQPENLAAAVKLGERIEGAPGDS